MMVPTSFSFGGANRIRFRVTTINVLFREEHTKSNLDTIIDELDCRTYGRWHEDGDFVLVRSRTKAVSTQHANMPTQPQVLFATLMCRTVRVFGGIASIKAFFSPTYHTCCSALNWHVSQRGRGSGSGMIMAMIIWRSCRGPSSCPEMRESLAMPRRMDRRSTAKSSSSFYNIKTQPEYEDEEEDVETVFWETI
jgi:hypothetical protein